MKSNFQDYIHLVQLRPKFFVPLDLGRPISNDLPPFPNDNQSVKKKHNPRITITWYQVFRSAFIFNINLLILSGFPVTSFHLAKANIFPRAILKKLKSYLIAFSL